MTVKSSAPYCAMSEELKRACSSALIQSIESWIPESLTPANYIQFSPSPIWQERIEKIVSEASYLGFTRLLRLCRAIQTGLQSSSLRSKKEGVVITHAEVEALACAWSAVRGLVVNYEESQHIDVASEVASLKEVFAFSDVEMQDSISVSPVSNAAAWSGDANNSTQQAKSSHVDTSVYRSDWIDTLDKCMEEETWILSQLVSLSEDLAAGNYVDRPAHKLMNILRRHRFFNRVDRVCMAGRVKNTNQLVVLDSSNSVRTGENTLKKGYSCFVNPDGSLFKMKPSTIRIFGECNRVLAAFAEQHKPAQRSIAYISDLGLRSGLCMSIGRGESIQGFLFLNSQEPGLFDDIKVMYAPLLSLFSIVTTLAMDANGFHFDTFHENERYEAILPKSSIPFDTEAFSGFIRKGLSSETNLDYAVSVTSKVNGNSFLYCPQTTIGAICNVVARAGFQESDPIEVVLDRVGNQTVVDVSLSAKNREESSLAFLARVVSSENAKLNHLPISLEMTSESLRVKFPYEPTLLGPSGQYYSIAF